MNTNSKDHREPPEMVLEQLVNEMKNGLSKIEGNLWLLDRVVDKNKGGKQVENSMAILESMKSTLISAEGYLRVYIRITSNYHYLTIKKLGAMKTLKAIGKIILIMMIGTCAILFAGYKIFLDKPGFFRQFEDEDDVHDYLLNDLTLDVTSRDYAIEYLHDHLSHGEGCGQLRDTSIDLSYCFVADCPAVTDETENTEMYCWVRAWDVLLEYRIALFFEYNTLTDIDVELISNMP